MAGAPLEKTREPSGHVRIRDGKVYAKLKIPRPDGTTYEPQRLLGKLWEKRSQPPVGYITKGRAEKRLEELKAEAVTAERAAAVVTFAQACDEHLRYLEHDRQRKRSYLNDCGSGIRAHLLPEIGADTPVGTITTADVDTLRERLLAGGLSHRTTQKALILLGGIMGRAQRKGWVDANPVRNAERVSLRRNDEFNVLTVEQVHAAARAAADRQHAAMILVAAFTGLRLGELLALRWRSIDFANRIVHVRRNLPAGQSEEESPKSHRARSVPLADQALAELDRLSRRDHDTASDDLVFCDVAGQHLLGDHVRNGFYAALEAGGLGQLREQDHPIVFHDLRHTFGTLCASKGIDLRRIQAWMGHADIQTTMRYLHHVPQHDDAARLTAAFAGDTTDLLTTEVTPA